MSDLSPSAHHRRRPTLSYSEYYTTPTAHSYPPINQYQTSLHKTDLPSRVAALNRRATIVTAHLAHLTAVVKPLESTKPEKLNQGQLLDMHREGHRLVVALNRFEEQVYEVMQVLTEVLEMRDERVVEDARAMRRMGVKGEEEWEVGQWERGRRVV
jgi:hypothetical protein